MWVGWVTPDYHQHDMNFDLSKVRAVTVTMGDEQGNVHSRYRRGVGTVEVGGQRWAPAHKLPSSSPLPVSLLLTAPGLMAPPLFPFLLFHFLLLFHLALLFLRYLFCLLCLPAPPPSPPSRNPHQLLRILAPRGSGSGVRGVSAQVCRWWVLADGV